MMSVISVLSACAAPAKNVVGGYNCQVTQLAVCDKKFPATCTDISNDNFTHPVQLRFYPDTLTVQSYSGAENINTNELSLWRLAEQTIFIAGHGINIQGDETVWSGSIDRSKGVLIVVGLSTDYNYIVNGQCQIL